MWNVDEYWSYGDEDEGNSSRNLCIVARKIIACDEGYWSFSSEADDEIVKPHYCYMATNNPPGRSIIQHVKYMITDNKFYLYVCEPYLT